MTKFPLAILIVVSVILEEVVESMKGGQVLNQPLPYTVYILTGDLDDLEYVTNYNAHDVAKTDNNLSGIEEYRNDEEHNMTSHVGCNKNGEPATNCLLNDTSANTTETKKGSADTTKTGDKRNISPNIKKNNEEGDRGRNVESENRGELPSTKNSSDNQGEAGPKHGNIKPYGRKGSLHHKTGLNETNRSLDNSSEDSTTGEDGKSTNTIPNTITASSDGPQGYTDSHEPSEDFEDTAPHCRLAAATARPTPTPKPPRPTTLWRVCMGVIFDNATILTGDICSAKAEGMHFIESVDASHQQEAQEIAKTADGRTRFDFRVIKLNKNETMPGEVANWQDTVTVFRNMVTMSTLSRTGYVPSFGHPPMIAALKLLPLDTCRRIYDELLAKYPTQTKTLPAFLINTVVCATQADKPIIFPGNIGLVKPGLACPDSLGAPFVLEDGTVLGVLVAADCSEKNVAFFQTLGKGTPLIEEGEDEEEKEEVEQVDHRRYG